MRLYCRRLAPSALAMLVTGCTAGPTQNIVGSYFPAWLICAVVGSIATVVIRQLLVLADLESHLILAPLTYAGMALSLCLLVWLAWFGQ